MIAAMLRRFAVPLYNAITRLRLDWHSEEPADGKVQVVITGSAADDQVIDVMVWAFERAVSDL